MRLFRRILHSRISAVNRRTLFVFALAAQALRFLSTTTDSSARVKPYPLNTQLLSISTEV